MFSTFSCQCWMCWLDDDKQVSVPVFATTSPTTSFPSTPRRWSPQQEKLLQSFEMIASLYAKKVWSYLNITYMFLQN